MKIDYSRCNTMHSVFIIVLLAYSILCSSSVIGSPQVPAIFALGDSSIDSGNTNYLNSYAKANYLPYGCDLKGGPTGRFCNGKTIVDFLGELLGVPYLPAFADPTIKGDIILSGVNYASFAAGILDETGRNWGDRFSLNQQVLNFDTTLDQLRTMMSARNLSHYLAKSIVIISIGTNDYINNYLLPSQYTTSTYAPQDFADLLINHYTRQILALYSVGLRKFFLSGIPPIGCIPNQRASGGAQEGRCLDSLNQMLGSFNEGLRALVVELNGRHPGGIFVYWNGYGVTGDILNNPADYGFKVLDKGCCDVGGDDGGVTCVRSGNICGSRREYMFWDGYHTTEAVNYVLAQRAFVGSQIDCYPINVQQLALI